METTIYTIRPAGFEDMEAILRLWQEMMREHQAGDPRVKLAPGAISAYRTYAGYHMSNHDSLILVATPSEGGEPIGFVLIAISRNLPMFLPARYGYLSDMAIAADWRRHGVGKALLEAAADWLRGRDVTSIQLQYYSFNENGGAFWQAMGFEPYYMRMWRDI